MNNNFNLQKNSILSLFLGINLAVLTLMILQNSNASEQPENIKKIPRDVIVTHFFKDLSARDILNFGQSCKKFKGIGDDHKTIILAKKHYEMLYQAIDQTAKTPNNEALPQAHALEFYITMFDKELKKYKVREKNKIMSLYGLSSREQQVLLQKLAVRLIFIKLGFSYSSFGAVDAARVSAIYSTAPHITLPPCSSLSNCIDQHGRIPMNSAKRDAGNVANFAFHDSDFFRLNWAIEFVSLNLYERMKTEELESISYNATAKILGNEVARITSNFFSTKQCKILTNDNNDSIKIGRFAWQIAQLEAIRIISVNAASYIEKLGLKLEEIISVDTTLPPFDSRNKFLSFLENNQTFIEYIASLKERNSSYFLDEAMEIISSVFDN